MANLAHLSNSRAIQWGGNFARFELQRENTQKSNWQYADSSLGLSMDYMRTYVVYSRSHDGIKHERLNVTK